MATQQRYFATVVDDAGSGGSLGWADASNASAEDAAYASVSGDSFIETHFLKLTNASAAFSLPAGATINSIAVRIRAKTDVGTVQFDDVNLVIGGSLTGYDNAPSGSIGTSDAYYTANGTPAQWGVASLTAAQVNAATFGVAVQCRFGETEDVVYIDAVDITVDYTAAAAVASSGGLLLLGVG